METKKYILSLSCPDDFGIVAALSSFITEHGGFIVDSSQFSDPEHKLFFMRIVFTIPQRKEEILEVDLKKLGSKFKMDWHIQEESYKPSFLLMVSKYSHCLNDILYKVRSGHLQIHVPAIVSNHEDLRHLADWYGIPFFHFPLEEKIEQEEKILQLIVKENIECIVLARYMQILSKHFCLSFPGKIINIHHSFLPSFKGAKPYHQAYERGVKIIGATAHYVTEDLDEGPIIKQEVVHVNHNHTPEKLIALGQDVESFVLSRAVKLHAERRVFLNGRKTVVFKE